MYHRIVLVYYSPGHSASALKQATSLARAFGAHLHLLGVHATAAEFALAKMGGTSELLERQRKRVETAVQNQAKRLRDQGLNVTESCCEGDMAIEIGIFAHRFEADLVVMGNPDKPSLTRWFKSEAGSRLLAHMPCSVLLP
jgi:nucleotide-binding universal stress UspA family protein